MLILSSTVPALAADSTVIWSNSHQYSDIDGGISDNNQAHHIDKVFNTFEKYFAKLASDLPDGQKLYIKVTNVDLAGEAWGVKAERTIREGTFPRMAFIYQLKAADGSIIKQSRVSLKDMHFMAGSSQFRLKFLNYETRMIRKWFKKEFSEQLDS